jgi:sulfate transport system ATP-binding protein
MEVADRIAVLNAGRIEQTGAPRDIYDRPANAFVMGFLGETTKLGAQTVRPHDVALHLEPEPGTVEAMVDRVVHLGFEVRVEMSLSDGERVVAQLSRHDADQFELTQGDIVHVRSTEASAEEPGPVHLSG